MGKKILFGGLVYIISELLGGIIFYISSKVQDNPSITAMDVIKLVFVTLLISVVFNAVMYFMFVVGQKQNNILIIHTFFFMVIIGLIGCIIMSFINYASIIGVLFLMPIFISCILWSKK